MGSFRFGLIDPGLHARLRPDLMLANTKLVATVAGAESMWIPDHLISVVPRSLWQRRHVGAAALAPDIDATFDPWTALGYVAARNRLSRLRIGVSVTDTGRRHPAVTAQAAATLHLLSRGRAILGIGPGERENNEPYGVDWTAPVSRFEEGLATIRALWDSGGQPFSRDSPFFPLRDAVFAVPPYRNSRPEIWIGAHGPRMLRLTGRHGDAWLPGFLHRASDYGAKLGAVRDAAADAGRDPGAVLPAGQFFVVTGSSPDAIDEALESPLLRVLGLCAGGQSWAAHGAVHPLGPDFAGAQDLLPQTLDESTALDHARAVPASLLREMVVCGTPDEVVDQLAAYRDHGLRYALLMNVSVTQTSLRAGLRSSGAFLSVLRRLRGLNRGNHNRHKENR